MNNLFDTDVQLQKNRTLSAVARLAFAGELDAFSMMGVSKTLFPDDSKPTMRCCIYKERAISDEYVKLACGGSPKQKAIVNVIPIACDECPLARWTG